MDCRFVLTNQIIDDFVETLKEWAIVFEQYPLTMRSLEVKPMRKYLLTALIVITSFLFGAGGMYLIDTTWVNDKVEKNKEQLNSKKARYSEALNVSHQLLNNCYDALSTTSRCSTSKGCYFESTVYSLIELNAERKVLQKKLDQLLGGYSE